MSVDKTPTIAPIKTESGTCSTGMHSIISKPFIMLPHKIVISY